VSIVGSAVITYQRYLFTNNLHYWETAVAMWNWGQRMKDLTDLKLMIMVVLVAAPPIIIIVMNDMNPSRDLKC
jgi:hypothetical protein